MQQPRDCHSTAGLVFPNSVRPDGFNRIGSGAIQTGSAQRVEVVAQVGTDHNQRFPPTPDQVEELSNLLV